MTVTKLKTKNQITIPTNIVKQMNLKTNELFAVDVVDNYIRLVPVDVEERYTLDELKAIDTITAREKDKAKSCKPGKEFSKYIRTICK